MPEPSPNRGVMIVLAYLWPLALIPLFLDSTDAEVRWHAKHGIVLAVAECIVLFAYLALTSIVSLATLGLGCLFALAIPFGWIAILALHLAAIVKGINGGRLIVPGVSAYADRF